MSTQSIQLPHEVLSSIIRSNTNSTSYQRTREMTIDELLLENRVVFLIGEIGPSSAARVMMQMLYLDSQKRGQDINFYINTPGGDVDETLAIYDTMQFISSEVSTYCIGRAYSGGALLLAAGQAKKRHILPNAKVMIHQPSGGARGQATDMEIQVKEILAMKKSLTQIYVDHNSVEKTYSELAKDMERDFFMSATDAVQYGLADSVLKKRP